MKLILLFLILTINALNILQPIEEREKNDLPENFSWATDQQTDCVPEIKTLQEGVEQLDEAGSTTFSWRFCIASKGQIKINLSAADSQYCNKETGGTLEKTWKYYTSTGVVTDQCFPYTSTECISECVDGSEWKKYKAMAYGGIAGIYMIQEEIYINGPVLASFTVYEDFLNYSGGIYEHNDGEVVTTAHVPIVGWGVENDIKYWICMYDQGKDWGENGYFRIKMDTCGIDSKAFAGIPLIE